MLSDLPDPTNVYTKDIVSKVSSLISEQVELMRRDPLTYGHAPHMGQEKLFLSKSLLTLLVAANRFGKSEGGMREVLWRATMTHPYKNTRPHDVIWCGFPDYGFYTRVTLPKFLEWAPKDSVIDWPTEGKKRAKIRRADGGVCTIHFMSYDSDRESWQGAGVQFCWLDEEMPEDIFHEAMARLIETRGEMLLTLTPVSGMGWIYDRLFLPIKASQRAGKVIEGALAEYDETKPYNIGKILVPQMRYEDVVRFAESIPDEDERAIRIFGMFRSRTGIVYKKFNTETHVIPAFEVPWHWEVWGGIDPGYHGFSVVLFAMSPEGRIYVVDEYFSQEESIQVRFPNIVKKIKKNFPKYNLEDTFIFYVDTANAQEILELNLWAGQTKTPVAFASLDQGLKARKAGITRVQELVLPRKNNFKPEEVKRTGQEQGEPLLYIFDSLHSVWRETIGDESQIIKTSRLVWEFQRYLWKEPPKGAPHPEDADERSAGGAHALAALRYGIMARMGAPDPIPENPYEEAGRHAWVWEKLDKMATKAEEAWHIE